jgi:hypothetical protein
VAEVIGFIMVFGVLGLLINSLATGVVRTVALALLAAIALIASGPMLQRLTPITSFFQPQTPTAQPYNVPNSSGNLPNSPASGQSNSSTSQSTGSRSTPPYSYNPNDPYNISPRPIPGGW